MKNIIVYDSGIGGVSIYRLIKKNLPAADYVYFADNKNFPYGNRSETELKVIAAENIKYLLSKYETDIIVLACNTLTCVAVETLRRDFPHITFVGTEPSIKQALLYTTSNIVVASTANTASNARLRRRFPSENIIWLSMPYLATMVENGERDKDIFSYIEQCAEKVESQYDCVVLGCTHYTLIKHLFAGVFAGKKIFDGAQGVAQYVRTLKQKDFRGSNTGITCLELTNPEPLQQQKYLSLIRDSHEII